MLATLWRSVFFWLRVFCLELLSPFLCCRVLRRAHRSTARPTRLPASMPVHLVCATQCLGVRVLSVLLQHVLLGQNHQPIPHGWNQCQRGGSVGSPKGSKTRAPSAQGSQCHCPCAYHTTPPLGRRVAAPAATPTGCDVGVPRTGEPCTGLGVCALLHQWADNLRGPAGFWTNLPCLSSASYTQRATPKMAVTIVHPNVHPKLFMWRLCTIGMTL